MKTPIVPNSTACKEQAKTLFKAGHLEQARSLYEKLRLEDEKDAESYYMLGCIDGQLGKYQDAARSFRHAVELQPNAFLAHCGLGSAYKKLGLYLEAREAFNNALKLRPENIPVLLEMAQILLNTGDKDRANQHLQTVLEMKPDSSTDLHGIGEVYHAKRCLKEAIYFYKQALKKDPNRANTLHRLGHVLHLIGKFEDAMPYYKQAVELAPNNPEVHMDMGITLMTTGNPDAARKSFKKALEIKPDYIDAIAGEAKLNEQAGHLDAAYYSIIPVVKCGVKHAGIATTFVKISQAFNCARNAIDYAQQVLSMPNLPSFLEEQIRFALGKLYDQLEDYDQAFDHYQRANQLKPNKFSPAEHISVISALKETFSWKYTATAPRATTHSNRPVFIVGMPRSGTSLTEQILASHPEVYGAGELIGISNMISILPVLTNNKSSYPFFFRRLNEDILNNLATEYLDNLNKLNNEAARVTDKMPQNFLHLGLISLVFPEARVIHCVRDPIDTCLSIFFQNFNDSHTYASNLEHIGHYYNQYKTLMQHYTSIINIPIMNVRYEELVNDQEAVSRKVVEFLELEWNNRCMEFYKTPRYISTSSYDQVRQPIYSKSMCRWKNYEKYLSPLLNVLEND